MPIANMPTYRQLFDFLCLASIAISVAEASGRTYLCRKECVHSDHRPCGDARMPMANRRIARYLSKVEALSARRRVPPPLTTKHPSQRMPLANSGVTEGARP